MSSIFDVIKTVILDPELEFSSIQEIFKGIDNLPTNHPFFTQMYEYTDEEIDFIIGDIVTICCETDQTEIIPLVNQLFLHILPNIDVIRYYSGLLSNKFIPETMLVPIVKSDPSISIPEILLQTIQGDRSYHHLYERIRSLINPLFVSVDVVTSLIQMAADRGNQEAYGFFRKAYASMTRFMGGSESNISRIEYVDLMDRECKDMDLYFRKLVTWRNTSATESFLDKPLVVREALMRLVEKSCGIVPLEEGILEDLSSKFILSMRHIRYFELLNWIETNDTFRRLYGPQQRGRILHYSEDMDLPEDPREDYMLYNQSSWYEGICDHCNMIVRPYQRCFRKPIVDGGWEGCYCSPTCVLRHILYMKYKIPREKIDERLSYIRKQLETFFRDIGIDYETGIGMLIRDYPVVQTDDAGDVLQGSRFRLPRVVIVPASEEMVPLDQPISTHDSMMDAGKDILEQLGLSADDFGLMEDDGETIRYTEEIIMSGEDIETYALVNYQTREWQKVPVAIYSSY